MSGPEPFSFVLTGTFTISELCKLYGCLRTQEREHMAGQDELLEAASYAASRELWTQHTAFCRSHVKLWYSATILSRRYVMHG